ncbi:UNVERIFIED_CONTAM: hypothetical protein Sradi_5309400 [Sesamum radiatum]|uniref:Uncharacterized protein n=1 Tax=Sesamum radiatum TaxID=300843 RepID=A0AAW2LMU1_SESRA
MGKQEGGGCILGVRLLASLPPSDSLGCWGDPVIQGKGNGMVGVMSRVSSSPSRSLVREEGAEVEGDG